MLESAEGNPDPAEIPCAKYVSSSCAQETGIWLRDTGKSKSSNAVTITYDRKALLCLGVDFFLTMLLISLHVALKSFRAVNFKLETKIRISQPYIHILSMPTELFSSPDLMAQCYRDANTHTWAELQLTSASMGKTML